MTNEHHIIHACNTSHYHIQHCMQCSLLLCGTYTHPHIHHVHSLHNINVNSCCSKTSFMSWGDKTDMFWALFILKLVYNPALFSSPCTKCLLNAKVSPSAIVNMLTSTLSSLAIFVFIERMVEVFSSVLDKSATAPPHST